MELEVATFPRAKALFVLVEDFDESGGYDVGAGALSLPSSTLDDGNGDLTCVDGCFPREENGVGLDAAIGGYCVAALPAPPVHEVDEGGFEGSAAFFPNDEKGVGALLLIGG